MPRSRKKLRMTEQSSFRQEELYYMVEYLTKQKYDNLPTGTHYTSAVKRRIMVALANRLEHKCGIKRSVRQLQKRWSDMKRREADFLLQIQKDLGQRPRGRIFTAAADLLGKGGGEYTEVPLCEERKNFSAAAEKHHKEVESDVIAAVEGDELAVDGATDYAQVEDVDFEQPDVTIAIIPKDEEPDTVLLGDFTTHGHLQATYKVEDHVEEEYCAAKVTQPKDMDLSVVAQGLVEDFKPTHPCPCGILQKIYNELVQQGERLRKLEEKVDLLLFK